MTTKQSTEAHTTNSVIQTLAAYGIQSAIARARRGEADDKAGARLLVNTLKRTAPYGIDNKVIVQFPMTAAGRDHGYMARDLLREAVRLADGTPFALPATATVTQTNDTTATLTW